MSLYLVPYHLEEDFEASAISGIERADRVIRATFPAGRPWQRLAALYEKVADQVGRSGDLPVVVSGDCTTALGTLAGLQKKGLDPAIVWFDAHGDFNTDETTLSGYLGGMPLAIAVGRGDQTVPRALGFRSVDEKRVVLVDARDLDPPEREALERSAVRHVQPSALAPERAGRVLPPGPIYLHLDVDVLDPPEFPGLKLPVPGGMRRADLAQALATVMATGRVVGIGLACTWLPERVDAAAASWVFQRLLAAEE